MNRPLHVWLLSGLCFAVLLAAMGWASLTVLRLDRAQAQASLQAEQEEKVRLALWRIDSSLTPLIIEESARPPHEYESFYAPAGAYTKSYAPLKQGDVLQASPLLAYASSNVLLHFQLSPAGNLSCPQVPPRSQRELAAANYVSTQQIETAATRLAEFQSLLNRECFPLEGGATGAWLSAVSSNGSPASLLNRDVLINQCAVVRTNTIGPVTASALALNSLLAFNSPAPSQILEGQQQKSSAEWQARANVYNVAQQKAAFDNKMQLPNDAPFAKPGVPAAPSHGVIKPLWLGQELVLARRIESGGRFFVQGCWLHWTNLRRELLSSVRDLFPTAELQPVIDSAETRPAHLLAALPAKFVPGPVPAPALAPWTPLRISLAVAWTCVLVAALAVAALLHGTVSLSERRAAFVSAVTHELRTPLTTFKMYSEMLAEGMVPDAARRKHYLDTLCSEANRLGHLVENVLAYARLERGSARSRVERLTLGALIDKVMPRLAQRAEQVQMRIVVDADAPALATGVHVDVAAVEQILFNLVDNACKYAGPDATERIIHLEALPEGRYAMLRVRDHGQGISEAGARRLFKPFCKSAHEAAHTAPGVGLGLALCRRLSRSMGGDLRFDALAKGGACFVLTLPVSRLNGTAPAASLG